MRVAILLGNGYEEIEALTVVDYLRRADIAIDMVSITGSLMIKGDHGILVTADLLFEEMDKEVYDLIVTPGGYPGSEMLAEHEGVLNLLRQQHESGRYIASICASPIVLEAAGLTGELIGTCFPGLEGDKVHFNVHKEDIVVHDETQRIITSRGPATAVYFALEIIRHLKGETVRDEIAEALLVPRVEAHVVTHAE